MLLRPRTLLQLGGTPFGDELAWRHPFTLGRVAPVIVPDGDLLVRSVDETSPVHARARRWWDGALSVAGGQ